MAGQHNSIGNENTFVGQQAGFSNTGGSSNIFIWKSAGYSNTLGQGNIFLGFKAGYNEIGSDKLYIDNSDTNYPLIYGEFNNNILTINGKLGIGTKNPAYSMELDTTGLDAVMITKRTDGVTNLMSATTTYAQVGSITNHPFQLLVYNKWRLRLNTNGSLNMANGASCSVGGVWLNASSRALKENIRSLSGSEALNALNNLNPVTFNYKIDELEKHVDDKNFCHQGAKAPGNTRIQVFLRAPSRS